MRFLSRFVPIALLALSTAALLACPDRERDSKPAPSTPVVAETPPAAPAEAAASPNAPASPDSPDGSASPATITPENVLANERYWPEIVALVEPFLPPDETQPLKKGYRGALVRIDEQGRARIDFGRHGKHEVPLRFTDLIDRANRVASGELYKLAPNFIAHYGTLFVHPTTPELVPYPTAELAKKSLFLCVFANPRDPDFEALVARLVDLGDAPDRQAILFPLAMKQNELEVVKAILKRVAWPVPFAYGEAAEQHARALLGEVPSAPQALLVTNEGRVLARGALEADGTLEAIRKASARP